MSLYRREQTIMLKILLATVVVGLAACQVQVKISGEDLILPAEAEDAAVGGLDPSSTARRRSRTNPVKYKNKNKAGGDQRIMMKPANDILGKLNRDKKNRRMNRKRRFRPRPQKVSGETESQEGEENEDKEGGEEDDEEVEEDGGSREPLDLLKIQTKESSEEGYLIPRSFPKFKNIKIDLKDSSDRKFEKKESRPKLNFYQRNFRRKKEYPGTVKSPNKYKRRTQAPLRTQTEQEVQFSSSTTSRISAESGLDQGGSNEEATQTTESTPVTMSVEAPPIEELAATVSMLDSEETKTEGKSNEEVLNPSIDDIDVRISIEDFKGASTLKKEKKDKSKEEKKEKEEKWMKKKLEDDSMGEEVDEDDKGDVVMPAKNILNLGFGIEEMPQTTEAEMNGEDVDLSEMSSTEISRYKYKLVNPDPSRHKYRLISEQAGETNKVYSLNNPSEDGLYHPEQAPSYSDLFQQEKEVVIEVDFNDQFGSKISSDRTTTPNKISLGDGNQGGRKEMTTISAEKLSIESRIDTADDRDSPNHSDVSTLLAEHRGPQARRPARVVVKELPTRHPYLHPHRPRHPTRHPIHNQPIYNYSPPTTNTVRGVLVLPSKVRSLPPRQYAPEVPRSSDYTPYRSKLDDFTTESAQQPRPAFKRQVEARPKFDDEIGAPPLASFVIARKQNETLPTYSIPHKLIPAENTNAKKDIASDKSDVVQTFVIPRPPGSPRPTISSGTTGSPTRGQARDSPGSSRLRFLDDAKQDSAQANSISRTVYTTPASYVMFSMGAGSKGKEPFSLPGQFSSTKPSKIKRQFGSKPNQYLEHVASKQKDSAKNVKVQNKPTNFQKLNEVQNHSPIRNNVKVQKNLSSNPKPNTDYKVQNQQNHSPIKNNNKNNRFNYPNPSQNPQLQTQNNSPIPKKAQNNRSDSPKSNNDFKLQNHQNNSLKPNNNFKVQNNPSNNPKSINGFKVQNQQNNSLKPKNNFKAQNNRYNSLNPKDDFRRKKPGQKRPYNGGAYTPKQQNLFRGQFSGPGQTPADSKQYFPKSPLLTYFPQNTPPTYNNRPAAPKPSVPTYEAQPPQPSYTPSSAVIQTNNRPYYNGPPPQYSQNNIQQTQVRRPTYPLLTQGIKITQPKPRPVTQRPVRTVDQFPDLIFVDQLPLKSPVKRFPQETPDLPATAPLAVNKPKLSRVPSSIVQVLRDSGLSIMAKLLEGTGLGDDLKSGEYTVFSPSDKAFNKFFEKLGGVQQGIEKLKKNPTELERIIKNHIVRGKVNSGDLADDLVGPSAAFTKLRSNQFTAENGDWREVKVLTINGGVVEQRDLEARNGVVHQIDRVLFPPTQGDLLQTLQNDPEERFTTFVKALQATRLHKEITDYNTGPWTVFAPTNAAFMNLPMKELEELITSPTKLSNLVLNHLINKTIYSAGLRAHQQITMANGNTINLFSRADRLKVEGSSVVNMDIPATNGVIQVVESIVEPNKNTV